MASVYPSKNGYSLQLSGDGARRTKRLGRLTKSGAAQVQVHVTAIEMARMTADHLSPSTVAWLDQISPSLYGKLAALGLVEPKGAPKVLPTTFGNLWDAYLAARPSLKPFSRSNLEQTRNRCADFFGAKPVATITVGDVKDFKRWLESKEYAQATVAGFLNKARQVLNDAVDRGILKSNPFRKVHGGSQVNKERRYFVPRDHIDQVIASCPDYQWRLLFALGRYAGIRVPSEAVEMKAADINFEAGKMIIHSPKTERHGKPRRVVPIFPELVKPLQEAIAMNPTGKLMPMLRPGYNPHTTTLRLIKRAGLKPWPKVWVNMRSTRETELIASGIPVYKVCAWIGNTEAVASKHYLQLTDADFLIASQGAAKSAAPEAGQTAHRATPNDRKPRYSADIAVLAASEPYQLAQDRGRTSSRKRALRRDFRPSAAKRAALTIEIRSVIASRKVGRLVGGGK